MITRRNVGVLSKSSYCVFPERTNLKMRPSCLALVRPFPAAGPGLAALSLPFLESGLAAGRSFSSQSVAALWRLSPAPPAVSSCVALGARPLPATAALSSPIRVWPCVSAARGAASFHSCPPAFAAKRKTGASLAAAAAATSFGDVPAVSSSGPDGGDEEGADLVTQLKKHVEFARRELTKVRGSVASPTMLDHVMVEAYGERHPMSGMGQVSAKSATALVVSPFDAAVSACFRAVAPYCVFEAKAAELFCFPTSMDLSG